MTDSGEHIRIPGPDGQPCFELNNPDHGVACPQLVDVGEPIEIELEMCEPTEPAVTASEIKWLGHGTASKGWELRGYNTGHWQVWIWEPSYWTGELVYNFRGSKSEETARLVFNQHVADWDTPDDEMLWICPEGRKQLARAVTNRVTDAPPPPVDPPENSEHWPKDALWCADCEDLKERQSHPSYSENNVCSVKLTRIDCDD